MPRDIATIVAISFVAATLTAGFASAGNGTDDPNPPQATSSSPSDGKAQKRPAYAKSEYDAIDADGNGRLTLGEFDDARTKYVVLGDTDRDGILSRAEIERIALATLIRRQADRMERNLDVDGDGTVTVEEIENRRKEAFDALDADGDGVLSRAEFGGSASSEPPAGPDQ
jgi:hypothetical protein